MFGRFKRIAGVFVVVGLCGTLAACGSPEPITTAPAHTQRVPVPAATAEPIALVPTVEPTAEPIAAEPTVEPIAAVAGRVQPVGGECPDTAPIKGNQGSMIYHVPGGGSYSRTRPEDCFATAADAEAAGYRRAKR